MFFFCLFFFFVFAYLARCVHYHVRSFRLEAFYNVCVGSGSRTPEEYKLTAASNWARELAHSTRPQMLEDGELVD
jgi:hypothetical protein